MPDPFAPDDQPDDQSPDAGGPPAASSAAPAASPAAAPPQRLLATNEFAALVRNKFNAYHEVPDDVLTHAFVQKYPVYQSRVVDILQGADHAPIPRFQAGAPLQPPPAPPDLMSTPEKLASAVVDVVESPFTGVSRMVGGLQKAGFPNEVAGQVNEEPPVGPQQRLTTQQAAEPIADVIGGAMEVGTMPMVAAIMADPVTALPALGAGMIAAHGAGKVAEYAGAPPAVVEIAQNVAGLAVGGVAAHAVTARRAARIQGISDLIDQVGQSRATVDETLQGEADAAHGTAEATMHQEFADETSVVAGEQQQQQRVEDLYSGLAFNAGLEQLAQAHKSTGAGGRSPFDYLDQVDTITAAADGTIRDPNRMLPPRQPRAFSAEPPNADYLGEQVPLDVTPPPDTLPGHIDAIARALEEGGLTTPPEPILTTGAAGSTSDMRLNDLGRAIDEALIPPPPAPIPDTLDGIRAQQDAEIQPFRAAARDRMVEDIEASVHQPGGMADTSEPITGGQGAKQQQYVPPVGAAPLYHQIVGDAKSPPKVSLIADVLRTYRDTGVTKASEIPDEYHLKLRQSGGYGPREFRQAYDRWMPSVIEAEGQQARYLSRTQAAEAARPKLVPGAVTQDAGAPPAGLSEDMPDFLQNLEADPNAVGGYDEEQPTLPGAEAVRTQEQPTPQVADLPFALTGETAPAATGAQPTFWDALKHDVTKLASDTEGSLRLTVGPDDEPGLRRWINNQRAAYGHEEWFQTAEDALDEGDHRSAYRIAATAAARYQMATLGQAQRKESANPPDSPAAADARRATEAAQSVIDRAKDAHRKQVEAELGMTLPKSVDVSPEGILTFEPGGKDVPALKARATDLTLARSLANDIVDKIDATQLLRAGTSDEVPPQLQVSKQIADQTAREFDDSTIQTLAEFMGFQDRPLPEQRLEVARQLSRTYSAAGRLLGDLGNWTQANEELMYHIGSVTETGAANEVGSVGALQAMGITDPDGFVRWLGGRATPEQLESMRFQLPSGVELKNDRGQVTEQAQRYAKNWFRRAQRLNEIQTTIDRVVGEQGTSLDRALAALTIAPDTGPSKKTGWMSAINGLSKAALISRPGTAIRNAISQTGRYGAGMADEAVAGLLSLATGNPDQAGSHFRMMKYLAQGTARSGNNVMSLFRHPWAEGLQATYDYTEAMVGGMEPEDMRKTISLLADLPHQEMRFLGGLSLDDNSTMPGVPESKNLIGKALAQVMRPEVRNTLTLFNRVQEFAFRGAVFDAVLRHQIEAKGLDPLAELTGDPRALIQKVGVPEFDRMAGAAVSASLDYTFASEPMPGTAPAMLLDAFRKVPVVSFLLQMGQPFARFNFVSAPRWVWDHTPFAPVSDMLLLAGSALRSDTSPVFRGRFSQMLQMRAQERTMMDLTSQIARAKYDSASALSDFMASKGSQDEAGKVLKGIQARASATMPLTELQPHIEAVEAQIQAAKDAQAQARIAWKQADVRVRNLEQQEAKGRQTVQNLQAVGAAKSPQEYFARIATGTAMMGAGYAFWKWKADHSTTPGSPDVQWYEFPTAALPETAQTLGGMHGQTIDLRAYAPEVQHLFLPDVLADVHSHTDWSEVDLKKIEDLHYLSSYMQGHYTGKYTGNKVFKDALEAYVSMSPAAGSTRDLLDIMSGAGEAGKSLDLGTLQDGMLAMAGQYVARFTSPLGAINDVVGQFSPEDAKARIPEEGTPESHNALSILGQPTLANIPFARRAIPEKVDALTGQPIAGVDPLARQFGGLTKRLQNRVRQELNATGLPYSAAVPRQTEDREFDNVVNKEYSQILNEYLPDVFDNEVYQQASPELRRDILAYGVPGESAIFPQLKKLAYANAIDKLGEQYQNKLQSPEVKAKLDRWQKFVDAADRELEPALHANEDQGKDQQIQDLQNQEPGAPPAGLP